MVAVVDGVQICGIGSPTTRAGRRKKMRRMDDYVNISDNWTRRENQEGDAGHYLLFRL
jgi:hypothetical protein